MGIVGVQIVKSALDISSPLFLIGAPLGKTDKTSSSSLDFRRGSPCRTWDSDGDHPVRDKTTKQYLNLSFFPFACLLDASQRRVTLRDDSVHQFQLAWPGKPSGSTQQTRTLVQKRSFTGAAWRTRLSIHRAIGIYEYCSYIAQAQHDRSGVQKLVIEKISRSRGTDLQILATEARHYAVIVVNAGKGVATVVPATAFQNTNAGDLTAIGSCSIDTPKFFISAVGGNLPNAQITFDKPIVITQASWASDSPCRGEQKLSSSLNVIRWRMLLDPRDLKTKVKDRINVLLTKRGCLETAWAGVYREQFRKTLPSRLTVALRRMLIHWCSDIISLKALQKAAVSQRRSSYIDGTYKWIRSFQTNQLHEALKKLSQVANRKSREYYWLGTVKAGNMLVAEKLLFRIIKPYQHA